MSIVFFILNTCLTLSPDFTVQKTCQKEVQSCVNTMKVEHSDLSQDVIMVHCITEFSSNHDVK